jgi:phosphoribosylpyrophosphate synthetase
MPCIDIPVKDSFLNMLSQTGIMEKPITHESRKTIQIRKKIKEIFGSDCFMNDDMLLKRYTITSDGELIVIVK